MKKVKGVLVVLIVLAICISTAAFADSEKSRSYKADMYKNLVGLHCGTVNQSAACSAGHSITYSTKMVYTYVGSGSYDSGFKAQSSVSYTIPSGAAQGKKVTGTFRASCASLTFPERSAADDVF